MRECRTFRKFLTREKHGPRPHVHGSVALFSRFSLRPAFRSRSVNAMEDLLTATRPVVDFGLVIVLWMAQLIVYPSFRHVDADEFIEWHHRYTRLISLFVIPLLSGQALIIGLQVLISPGVTTAVSAVLTAFCWASTFLLSVPCHRELQRRGKRLAIIDRLVKTNMIRTIPWTAVFVLGIGNALG